MIEKQLLSNLFLNTPNIFELQYKKGNKPHPFLNLFKPCFLSDMSVNYTSENVYATYSDGTPLSLNLTLTFKEILPIYETDYKFNPRYDTPLDLEEGELPDLVQFNDDDLLYGDGQSANVQGVGF